MCMTASHNYASEDDHIPLYIFESLYDICMAISMLISVVLILNIIFLFSFPSN